MKKIKVKPKELNKDDFIKSVLKKKLIKAAPNITRLALFIDSAGRETLSISFDDGEANINVSGLSNEEIEAEAFKWIN